MTKRRTILMTGISSGMGLIAARQLLNDPSVQIITGVRSPKGVRALSSLPSDRLTVLHLDLASLASVSRFCGEVEKSLGDDLIEAVALNAGIQITSGLTKTEDGVETTFAVNHLGHWLIFDRLKKRFAPGARVVLTASGTHDPEDPIAKRFGFRGGIFPSADAVVHGVLDPDARPAQACLDRYATSKLCNVMQGLHWAATEQDISVVIYDPGLMPGTGLARDRGAIVRFAWSYVMPVLRPLMKGVSTPEISGAMLSRLLKGEVQIASGDYIAFGGDALEPWAFSKDSNRQIELDRISAEIARNHHKDHV